MFDLDVLDDLQQRIYNTFQRVDLLLDAALDESTDDNFDEALRFLQIDNVTRCATRIFQSGVEGNPSLVLLRQTIAEAFAEAAEDAR